MKPMSRRQFLQKAASGAVVAAGLAATSCAAPGTNPDGGVQRLDFWAFSDTRIAWQQQAWDRYKQERNPPFELNFLILPFNQMHDKVMITSQAGAGGPDIADIEIGQFSRFIKGDVLFADMKPKLDAGGLLDQLFAPSATDPWTWQGKIYGIGNELNACLMAYRWDIYEQAGITLPIETWEDFAEQSQRFNEATGNHLLDIQWDDWGQWWMLTLQQGGGFFDEQGLPVLDAEAGVRTLEFQQRALREGWSTRRALGPARNAALGSGEIATILGPSWEFSGFTRQNIPDTEGKWRLQAFPRWTADGSRTATWGGTGVSVLKTSEAVDAALDFVLWEHTTTETVMVDYDERNVWPTYRPAFEQQKLNEPIPFFDNQEVGPLLQEMAAQIPTWYNSPFWPETTNACGRIGITPALQTTTQAPQAAMDAAQAESDKIIAFQTA